MTVDPAVIPGFLLLAAELGVLAAVGYVVVRVALRQDDERMALAQGLVVGLALWGLITNFVLYAVPGMAGAAVGWGVTLVLGGVLAWRAPALHMAAPARGGRFHAVACPGAVLDGPRQSPTANDSRRGQPPGSGRLDPRGRIPAGVALESGYGCPVPLRH